MKCLISGVMATPTNGKRSVIRFEQAFVFPPKT
jgi:hypothetical protein